MEVWKLLGSDRVLGSDCELLDIWEVLGSDWVPVSD